MNRSEYISLLPSAPELKEAMFNVEMARRFAAPLPDEIAQAQSLEELPTAYKFVMTTQLLAVLGMHIDGVQHAIDSFDNSELAYKATHDQLTGQLNLRGLLEWAEKNYRPEEGRTYGILFLDVSNFKAVNDVLNHKAGDETLCTIFEYLSSNIRLGQAQMSEGLTVDRREHKTKDLMCIARVGGDEIVCVLDFNGMPEEKAFKALEEIKERLKVTKQIATSSDIPGKSVEYGFTVGCVLTSKTNPLTIEEAKDAANVEERNYKRAKQHKKICADCHHNR